MMIVHQVAMVSTAIQLVAWLWCTAYYFVGFWVHVGGKCGGVTNDFQFENAARSLSVGVTLPTSSDTYCSSPATTVLFLVFVALFGLGSCFLNLAALQTLSKPQRRRSNTPVMAFFHFLPIVALMSYAVAMAVTQGWMNEMPLRHIISFYILFALSVGTFLVLALRVTFCKPDHAGASTLLVLNEDSP